MFAAAKFSGVCRSQGVVVCLPVLIAGTDKIMPFEGITCAASYRVVSPAGQQYRAVALHQAPLAVLVHRIIPVRNQIILGQHNRRVAVALRQHDRCIAGALRSRRFRRFWLGYSWCFGRLRCRRHRSFGCLRGGRHACTLRRFRRAARQQQRHGGTKHSLHLFSLLALGYFFIKIV